LIYEIRTVFYGLNLPAIKVIKMSKTKIYKNTLPLDVIALKLGNHLQEKKQEVAYCGDEVNKTWCFIQTRRHGYLTSEKCMNISIEGTRDECKISIDGGKWGENNIDKSNQPILKPYDGIYATDKKSISPIISKKYIWKYLDKNI
jgi:hypothetical protein